jgi:hypothetical protein
MGFTEKGSEREEKVRDIEGGTKKGSGSECQGAGG